MRAYLHRFDLSGQSGGYARLLNPPDHETRPNDTPGQVARVVALRESMLALAQFAQRAFAAYSGSRPSGTFVENP